MNKILQTNKKLIPIAVVILLLVLFGVIRPAFSASSTSYLFGLIDKEPNAKSLVKELLKEQTDNSNDGKIFQPFGRLLMNLDSSFDPNFDRSTYTQQELEAMQRDAIWWDYDASKKVINKLELVKCEKEVIHDTSGYSCQFILNNLSGTGLYEGMVEGRSIPFGVNIIKEDGKYKATRFYDL
jgi:hypothetical protein